MMTSTCNGRNGGPPINGEKRRHTRDDGGANDASLTSFSRRRRRCRRFEGDFRDDDDAAYDVDDIDVSSYDVVGREVGGRGSSSSGGLEKN